MFRITDCIDVCILLFFLKESNASTQAFVLFEKKWIIMYSTKKEEKKHEISPESFLDFFFFLLTSYK